MLNIQKAKLTGDYLHTSAIIVGDGQVLSAVNDVNDYAGPATGYRLQGERWEEIKTSWRTRSQRTWLRGEKWKLMKSCCAR